jgi:hypothetical protein
MVPRPPLGRNRGARSGYLWAPLGLLGALLNRLVICPELGRIFNYRREHLPRGPVEPMA